MSSDSTEDQVRGRSGEEALLQHLFSSLAASSRQSESGDPASDDLPLTDEAGNADIFPKVGPAIKIPYLGGYYSSSDDDSEKPLDSEKPTSGSGKKLKSILKNKTANADSAASVSSKVDDFDSAKHPESSRQQAEQNELQKFKGILKKETSQRSSSKAIEELSVDSLSAILAAVKQTTGTKGPEDHQYDTSVSAHPASKKMEELPEAPYVSLQTHTSYISHAGDKAPPRFQQSTQEHSPVCPPNVHHASHSETSASSNLAPVLLPQDITQYHSSMPAIYMGQPKQSGLTPGGIQTTSASQPPDAQLVPSVTHSTFGATLSVPPPTFGSTLPVPPPTVGVPPQVPPPTSRSTFPVPPPTAGIPPQVPPPTLGAPLPVPPPTLGAPLPVPPPIIQPCPPASSIMFHQHSTPPVQQQASVVQYPRPPAIYQAQPGVMNPTLNLAPSNLGLASGTCAPVSLNSLTNQATPVSAPLSVPSSGGTANYPGLVSYPLPISRIPPWAKTQTPLGGVPPPGVVYPTALAPSAANTMVSEYKSGITKEVIRCPEHGCQGVVFDGSPAFARHWEKSHMNRRYGPCVYCLKEDHVRIFHVKDEDAMEQHCELVHPEVDLKDKPTVYHMFVYRSRKRSSHHHSDSSDRYKKRSRSRSLTPDYSRKRSKSRSPVGYRRKRSRSHSRSPDYGRRKRSRSRSRSPGHSRKGISSHTDSSDSKRQKMDPSKQTEQPPSKVKEIADLARRNAGSCEKQSIEQSIKEVDNSKQIIHALSDTPNVENIPIVTETKESAEGTDDVGRKGGSSVGSQLQEKNVSTLSKGKSDPAKHVSKTDAVTVVNAQYFVFEQAMRCPVVTCSKRRYFMQSSFTQHWKGQHLLPTKGPCKMCLKDNKIAIVSTKQKDAFERHFKLHHNLVDLGSNRSSLFINRADYHYPQPYKNPSPFYYSGSKKPHQEVKKLHQEPKLNPVACPVEGCHAHGLKSPIKLARHWRFFHNKTVEYYVCITCEQSNKSGTCDPVRKLPWTMFEHLKGIHGLSDGDIKGPVGKLFQPGKLFKRSLVRIIQVKNTAYRDPGNVKCPVPTISALADCLEEVDSVGEMDLESTSDAAEQESDNEIDDDARIPNGLYLLPVEMAQTLRCLYKECISFQKNVEFKTQSAVTKHYIEVHAKEKIAFFCGICGFNEDLMEPSKKFDNVMAVKYHFQIAHSSLNALTCSVEHYNPKYIVSDWIPNPSSTARDFTYVGKESETTAPADEHESSVPGHRCPVPHCYAFERFEEEHSYQNHWSLVHEPLVPAGYKCYLCQRKKKYFYDFSVLGVRNHLVEHHEYKFHALLTSDRPKAVDSCGMAYNTMYINPGGQTLKDALDELHSKWQENCGMISFHPAMTCPVEGCPAGQSFDELKSFEDHWLRHHVPFVTGYDCAVCLKELASYSEGQHFDKSILTSHFISEHNDGGWVKDSDLINPASCAWIRWTRNPNVVSSEKFWMKGLPHSCSLNNNVTKEITFPDDMCKTDGANDSEDLPGDPSRFVIKTHKDMKCPLDICPYKGSLSNRREVWMHWCSFHATLEAYECLLCTDSDREMRHTSCTFRSHLRACHPKVRDKTEDLLPTHIMKRCHIPGLQYFNPGKFVLEGEDPNAAVVNTTINTFREHFKKTPLFSQPKVLESKAKAVLNELAGQKPSKPRKPQRVNPDVQSCCVDGCPLVMTEFNDKSQYMAHWEFCHRPWVRLYACSLCSVSFVGYSGLLLHVDEMHPEIRDDGWNQHITFEWIPTRFYVPAKFYQISLPGDEFHDRIVMQEAPTSLPLGEDMEEEKIIYKTGMKCPVKDCNKGPFTVQVDYDLHWLKCHVPVTTKFTCALCGIQLPEGVSTIDHLENEHRQIDVKATVMSGGLCDLYYVSPCPDKNPDGVYSISGGFRLHLHPQRATETAQNITQGRIKLQVIQKMWCPIPGCFVPGAYKNEKSFGKHWFSCHQKFRPVFSCNACRTGAQKLNALSTVPKLISEHIDEHHKFGESKASNLLVPTIFFVDPGRFSLDYVGNRFDELSKIFKPSPTPTVKFGPQKDLENTLLALSPSNPEEASLSDALRGSPKYIPERSSNPTLLSGGVKSRPEYSSAKPVGMSTMHDVDERQACFVGDIDERVHSHEQKPGRNFYVEVDNREFSYSQQTYDVDYRESNEDIFPASDVDLRDFTAGHGFVPQESHAGHHFESHQVHTGGHWRQRRAHSPPRGRGTWHSDGRPSGARGVERGRWMNRGRFPGRGRFNRGSHRGRGNDHIVQRF